MPTFKVNVKWGKEKFKDVEVNTDEDPEVFRAQIFAITNVSPENQKIMCKGMTLKEEWGKFPVKNKANILLMGTAGDIPDEPEEKDIVFAEDLPKSAVMDNLPLGLVNVGNTCYMNATLQTLKSSTFIREAAKREADEGGSHGLFSDMANLFKEMDSAKDRTTLDRLTQVFWMHLQTQYAQFAEVRNGVPAQQDASEFWEVMMGVLNSSISQTGSRGGAMSQYFGVDKRETTACAEEVDEQPSVQTTSDLSLSCHIDKEVGYVLAGLKKGIDGEITKNCPTLGRDAVYTTKKLITRLPSFLAVKLVRFYFKREAQENCKIRKDVKFPLTLDVLDLCADDFKEKLIPAREKFTEFQDWEAEQQASVAGKKSDGKSSEPELETHPSSFEDDEGSNNSGYYELRAVLTHKGRSSDSGHYVSWIRDTTSKNKWYLFDDKKVSVHTDADVLKLSGGGDWHTAYVLLYEAAKCPVVPKEPKVEQADDMDATADN